MYDVNEFRQIPYKGFENYSINCEGIMKNNNPHFNAKEDVLWQYNEKGYVFVRLVCKGKSRKAFVHRLVALCFIEGGSDDLHVLHNDDNPANPHYTNLRWGTQKENMQQSSQTGHYNTVKQEATLISPEGEKVFVRGLRAFCDEHNLDWGNFSRMVKKRKVYRKLKDGTYKEYIPNSVKGWRLAD